MARPRKNASKKTSQTHSFTRDLIPKGVSGADTQYVGHEPSFSIGLNERRVAVISAFGWYGRFYGRKEAKEILVGYLELSGRAAEAKQIRKVQENSINTTLVWLARMSLRGLALTHEEKGRVENHIFNLISTLTSVKSKTKSLTGKAAAVENEPATVSNRPNVQVIMKERALEMGGELEGMYDDFLLAGPKAAHAF